eukprot:UN29588
MSIKSIQKQKLIRDWTSNNNNSSDDKSRKRSRADPTQLNVKQNTLPGGTITPQKRRKVTRAIQDVINDLFDENNELTESEFRKRLNNYFEDPAITNNMLNGVFSKLQHIDEQTLLTRSFLEKEIRKYFIITESTYSSNHQKNENHANVYINLRIFFNVV